MKPELVKSSDTSNASPRTSTTYRGSVRGMLSTLKAAIVFGIATGAMGMIVEAREQRRVRFDMNGARGGTQSITPRVISNHHHGVLDAAYEEAGKMVIVAWFTLMAMLTLAYFGAGGWNNDEEDVDELD